jgi:hypothetical protein
MQSDTVARGYAALVGVVLVAIGLLGFVDNPLVGSANAVFPTGAAHNVLHLVTGLAALFIAFGLSGAAQANAVIAFGVLYAVVFVAVLLSPTLFGLFDPQVTVPDHVLNAAIGIASITVGSMARSARSARS